MSYPIKNPILDGFPISIHAIHQDKPVYSHDILTFVAKIP